MIQVVPLRSGRWSAAVAPELGGALISLRVDGVSILRETSEATLRELEVRGTACYVMLPYANRIAGATFEFGGRTWPLRRNFGNEPNSIHGVGWRRRWTLESCASNRVTLCLRHRGDEDWPFPFTAIQELALEDGLNLHIAVTNDADTSAPMGLGIHPYFVRSPSSEVKFIASKGWRNDSANLPATDDLEVAWANGLDNDFQGWSGRAEITGARNVTLDADTVFAWLRIYSPIDRDFIVVEPVTHAANAINRHDTSMAVMPRGGTLAGRVRIGSP